MILHKIEEYRSTPMVSMSNNKVRITLSMTLNEWRIFRKHHEIELSEK